VDVVSQGVEGIGGETKIEKKGSIKMLITTEKEEKIQIIFENVLYVSNSPCNLL